MESFTRFSDPLVQELIHLGATGFYPLFQKDWFKDFPINSKKLLKKEKLQLKSITNQLSKYRSIQKKKTFFFSLSKNERSLFIKAFMMQIENNLLNKTHYSH